MMRTAAKETEISPAVLERIYDARRETVRLDGDFDLRTLEIIVEFLRAKNPPPPVGDIWEL